MVTEEDVGERLVAVREPARDPDRDRIVVADVDAHRLAAVAVEDDDTRRSGEAREEVGLAALVIVEPANYAGPREGDVGLAGRGGESAVAAELIDPAALVAVQLERDQLDAVDHPWFAPCARTWSLTA